MPRIEYAIMKLHKDQHYFNKTSANSRFAKAGVPRFYESEVLNSSSVHLMKLSTKNPRLRKAANRYNQLPTPEHHPKMFPLPPACLKS